MLRRHMSSGGTKPVDPLDGYEEPAEGAAPLQGGRVETSFESKTVIDRRGLYKTGKDPFRNAAPLQPLLGPDGEPLSLSKPELPSSSASLSPADAAAANPNKSPLTPLVAEIKSIIRTRGPMTVAEWMSHCLGHPQYGYYMQREAIGKKGDFITSPEIVAVFGEMLGVWCVATWMRLGRPPAVQLVELGPGRGTLMKDMLSAIARFPEMMSALSVHMVENSVRMREAQRETLGVVLDDRTADNNVMTNGELDPEQAKEAVS